MRNRRDGADPGHRGSDHRHGGGGNRRPDPGPPGSGGSQATALNTGAPAGFPRINGYVLIPNEGGSTACIISSVRIDPMSFPKRVGMQKDFGLVDLPFPSRVMSLTPIGTLKARPASEALSFRIQRGVDVFPSVGDPVLLPGIDQLHAIVEGESETAGRILIGHCPTAARAPAHLDPDKLFGRHLAVLGNTGAGKSCSVPDWFGGLWTPRRKLEPQRDAVAGRTRASSCSTRMESTPAHSKISTCGRSVWTRARMRRKNSVCQLGCGTVRSGPRSLGQHRACSVPCFFRHFAAFAARWVLPIRSIARRSRRCMRTEISFALHTLLVSIFDFQE